MVAEARIIIFGGQFANILNSLTVAGELTSLQKAVG